MSQHLQPVHYDYPLPPEHYFVEERDVYPEDYCDGDCVPQNVTTVQAIPSNMIGELYSRNPTIVPVRLVTYNRKTPHIVPKQLSEQYIQQPHHNRNSPSPRSYYSKHCEPTRDYFHNTTVSQHEMHYGTKAYQSAFHNVEPFPSINCRSNNLEVEYSRIPRPIGSKKFPITFATPKYYKKPTPNTVYKRPSALCLPGTTQPDPAVIRRPKKVPIFTDNCDEGTHEPELIRPDSPSSPAFKPASGYEMSHRVGGQGDVNVKIPDFEEMFDQMERKITTSETENKDEIAKIAKLLKPRVPATIRARQDKCKLKSSKKTPIIVKANKTTDKQQQIKKDAAAAAAAPSLEKLLHQLKKCELVVDQEEFNRKSPVHRNRQEIEKTDKEIKKDDYKADVTDGEVLNLNLGGFNYQDINENMRSKCNFGKVLEETNQIENLTYQMNATSNGSSSRPKNLSKPTLDDNCALELHKSKSYIVNLIDRALSKELGTVPNNRCHKELESMNPKRAIELMNRHAGERDLPHSVTESHLSNYTNHDTMELLDDDQNSAKCKVCNCSSEEPTYIRQLKQLRWGHLRHIQREIKRLEELERFLDSCSTIPD